MIIACPAAACTRELSPWQTCTCRVAPLLCTLVQVGRRLECSTHLAKRSKWLLSDSHRKTVIVAAYGGRTDKGQPRVAWGSGRVAYLAVVVDNAYTLLSLQVKS